VANGIAEAVLDRRSGAGIYLRLLGYLRDRLRVFGFATELELDNPDVRFSTKPYVFSSRRWEAPLIEPLDLTGPAANEDLA
jgi:hypothetical protein